jgi:hypothetical protein
MHLPQAYMHVCLCESSAQMTLRISSYAHLFFVANVENSCDHEPTLYYSTLDVYCCIALCAKFNDPHEMDTKRNEKALFMILLTFVCARRDEWVSETQRNNKSNNTRSIPVANRANKWMHAGGEKWKMKNCIAKLVSCYVFLTCVLCSFHIWITAPEFYFLFYHLESDYFSFFCALLM